MKQPSCANALAAPDCWSVLPMTGHCKRFNGALSTRPLLRCASICDDGSG